MSVLVIKSSPQLVSPSEPTPGGNFSLTSADKPLLCYLVTSFHVFDRPIHEPAETIRRALSHALVHYYPVAGRLAVGAGGDSDVQVECTGEGVVFVAATAKCTLEDVRFLHAPLVVPLADLAARYGGPCRMSDPLLMAQVTEFACCGYVVGVTWNHAIADGFGMALLLQAVGELARGLSTPSVVPVRYDRSLPEISRRWVAAALGSPPAGCKHVDMAYTDVTIPWSFINRVKAEFRSRYSDGVVESSSTFEVVAAAIWQCRTRATNADPSCPAPLTFAVNVRKHVGAKDGYYGNCLTAQLVMATSGEVANSDVVDVVRLIKKSKERIRANIFRNELANMEPIDVPCWYSALGLSSWGGIGLDCVDFGSGRPARVMANVDMAVVKMPFCFPCLPCSRKDSDGANVIAYCVTVEHVEVFQAQLAKLR